MLYTTIVRCMMNEPSPARGSTPVQHEGALDAPRHSAAGQVRVGVLGLGSMGLPMAHRLLLVHGALSVHSRSRKKSIIEAGGRWAATPRELGEACDALLVMLPDLPQLEKMLDGPKGLLAIDGELLLMIGSTSSPAGVRALASRLRESSGQRIRVLDCPVSGGDDGARSGTLSIMAGGEDDDIALAAAVLAPCGEVRRMGPLGAGEVAKACNQMIVGATMMALADATVLAERYGIRPADLYDALSAGYAGSHLLEAKRRQLQDEDYTPGGIAAYMLKDLGFVRQIAEATETSPALLSRLQEIYSELVKTGLGDQDLSVARRFVSER